MAKKNEPILPLPVSPLTTTRPTTSPLADPTTTPIEDDKQTPAAKQTPQAAMLEEATKFYDEMRAKKTSYYKNKEPQLNKDGSVTLWFKNDKDADDFYTKMMKEGKNFTVRDNDGEILYRAKDGVLEKREGWLNPKLKDFVKDEEVMRAAVEKKDKSVMTPIPQPIEARDEEDKVTQLRAGDMQGLTDTSDTTFTDDTEEDKSAQIEDPQHVKAKYDAQRAGHDEEDDHVQRLGNIQEQEESSAPRPGGK